ncbi:NUDIX hydrolase [Rhodococcus sp. IEGM 1409]|uniref:NUDIX hydrolase n=1 Tax=Rhodococcus sp. IEGM 1409 TaxID=3047082 RepID=UPI0024B68D31|nr:NUDIX hydrolase [Rhodococcus sp. IEGM 1409]MDI9902150.1 NUDIX hydrolase [Rhodococcus sp. IEGM 1409]
MRGDGDGWSIGSDGTRHWGKHGAAGLLLRAPDSDGSPMVLLQHRAAWSHQGGTWALPGGARDSHESTTHAAVREAHEEAGIAEDAVRVRGEVVTMRAESGWTYTTVVADAAHPLSTVANGESTELRWVREADVDSLPLHPGFGSSWPELRTAPVPTETGDQQPGDQHNAAPHTVVFEGGGFGWLSGNSTEDSDQNLSEVSSTQS